MKIYFAAAAPGNEKDGKIGKIFVEKRLLSYFLIKEKKFECDNVFNQIKDETTISNKRERRNKR